MLTNTKFHKCSFCDIITSSSLYYLNLQADFRVPKILDLKSRLSPFENKFYLHESSYQWLPTISLALKQTLRATRNGLILFAFLVAVAVVVASSLLDLTFFQGIQGVGGSFGCAAF